MTSRREKLEAMLRDDPTDVFLRYALAMELGKEGQLEDCIDRLSQLMRESPPFVPAFFMSAQKLEQLQRRDDARQVLREGIETARQQGDQHAAAEMSEFLASLGVES